MLKRDSVETAHPEIRFPLNNCCIDSWSVNQIYIAKHAGPFDLDESEYKVKQALERSSRSHNRCTSGIGDPTIACMISLTTTS